jgi:hypothetical protein
MRIGRIDRRLWRPSWRASDHHGGVLDDPAGHAARLDAAHGDHTDIRRVGIPHPPYYIQRCQPHMVMKVPTRAAKYTAPGQGSSPKAVPRCKPINAPAIPTRALVRSLLRPMCSGNHDFANELNAMLATMPRTIVATKLTHGEVISPTFLSCQRRSSLNRKLSSVTARPVSTPRVQDEC